MEAFSGGRDQFKAFVKQIRNEFALAALGEIISPSTARLDRIKKMANYAEHGVSHFWLIDPILMTLEAYRLESGRWLLLGSYAENDKVRVEPFQEIEIDLSDLWPKGVKEVK